VAAGTPEGEVATPLVSTLSTRAGGSPGNRPFLVGFPGPAYADLPAAALIPERLLHVHSLLPDRGRLLGLCAAQRLHLLLEPPRGVGQCLSIRVLLGPGRRPDPPAGHLLPGTGGGTGLRLPGTLIAMDGYFRPR
jgi:hypothetical protein